MLLEMRDVSKSFGATRALEGVSLELEAGEVRALIGENGAGKSTLMKILSGAIRPDSGSMNLNGAPYAPRGPRDALARGVAMIYQELALAPHLSVEANVMLGPGEGEARADRPARASPHRHRGTRPARSSRHPARGQGREPGRRCPAVGRGGPSTGFAARESSSSTSRPAAFPKRDAERLFAIIDRLRKRGLGIIYISHFLEEVRRVAQTYTVLRDGRAVADGNLAGTEMKSIITQMVGRELDELFPRVPHSAGEPILVLDALRVRKAGSPASLVRQARRDSRHRGLGRRGPDDALARLVRARARRLRFDPDPSLRRRLCSLRERASPRAWAS